MIIYIYIWVYMIMEVYGQRLEIWSLVRVFKCLFGFENNEIFIYGGV